VFCDDLDRDTLKVPEGAERGTRNEIPDAPLQPRSGMIDDGIGGDDDNSLSSAGTGVASGVLI
jgi:hypothetical protein